MNDPDRSQVERFDSERAIRSSRPKLPVALSAIAGAIWPAPTVLVIDDNADIRDVVCSILESEGFRTANAANGREGLELLATLEPRPSLILLDLMMPVMSGWEFYARLSRTPGLMAIPVLVMTAHGGNVNLGSVRCLRKPLEIDQLLEAVRSVCAV